MNKVVRERFKSIEKARKLQAKEYQRRLEALNHEAARIQASQDKSISVERFDGFASQLNTRMDQLKNDIQILSDGAKKQEGRSAWTERYIPWGIVVIMTIVSILLSYFQIRKEL